jgi:hypothetical protein
MSKTAEELSKEFDSIKPESLSAKFEQSLVPAKVDINKIKEQFPMDYESVKRQSAELIEPYKSMLAKISTIPVAAVRSLIHADINPLKTELFSQTPTEEGSFSKDLGPLGGTIADIGVGSVLGSALKKIPPILTEAAIGNTESSLLRGSIPKSIKQELVATPREVGKATEIRDIAETANRFGLIPYMAEKTKILRKLTGDIYKGRKISTGIIGEKSNELSSIISSVSGDGDIVLGKKDLIPSIADKVKDTFRGKYSPTLSGTTYNESIDNLMTKEVDSFLKPSTIPYGKKVLYPGKPGGINIPIDNKALSLQFESMNPSIKDLLKLKRAAQSKAYEMGKLAEQGVESARDKHEVYNQIWRTIDDKIYEIAENIDKIKGTNIASKVRVLNKDISDLMNLHDIVKDTPIYKGASMLENIVGSGALAAGANAAGLNPLVGAGYPLLRKTVGTMAENFPGKIASGQASIADTINSIPSGFFTAPAASAPIRQYNELNNFQIPMNTEKILKNTNLVYAKIMQEFGQEAAIAFRDAKSKQQIMGMVRIFQKQKPLIFERSKYNNFDGIIDPPFKQQAVEDIIKDKNLPAHVNAEKMQKLLHDGLVD